MYDLSAMVGRQLAPFGVIVPFWLIAAFAGINSMLAIWPAVLVAGVSFAVPQFLISNYHGPWLVGVGSAVVSMGALTLFLRFWKPRDVCVAPGYSNGPVPVAPEAYTTQQIIQAWMPWVILSVRRFHLGIAADQGVARWNLGHHADSRPRAAQPGLRACRPLFPRRGRRRRYSS